MSETTKINQELATLSNKLALASNEYTDLCRAAATARSGYDVAKAKAVLKSTLNTATERAAEATMNARTGRNRRSRRRQCQHRRTGRR